MTLEEARKQFAHTWTDLVYLNHAAVSPVMFRVRDAVDNYLKRRSLKGIEPYPWAVKMAMEVRVLIANLINAHAENIAFVQNTGEGLNVLASGLDWKPGDHVLVSNLEFPANLYPFLNLRRLGVEVEIIEAVNWMVTPEMIAAKIRPETKLVSISMVQYRSGQKTDLAAIGKICRERDILLSVDAIQGLPHTPVDVQAANIDFLSSGSHKWMMALDSVGFIYVGERAMKRITQAQLGWTSVTDAFNVSDLDPTRLRPDAGRFEVGTLNFIGIAGLKSAIEFFYEFGLPQVERRVLDLSGYLIDRLTSRGIEVITPPNERDHSGIVTFVMENPEEVLKRLASKEIIISLRSGFLRASPHFYNTEEEVRKLYVEVCG